jgi:hypothetical protein
MARLALDLPDDLRRERDHREGTAGAGHRAVEDRLTRRPHVDRWLACWARERDGDR